MMKTIPVYGHAWHSQQSPAQKEVLMKPLFAYMQFEQRVWDSWNLDLSKLDVRASPIVFFFFPPPPDLLANPDARLIWIPMWDEARQYGLEWWQRLPKNVRVVSFSRKVSERARAVGRDVLDLRYALSPAECDQVGWNNQRILFYWNRTGMVGKEFLRKMCEVLEIDILLFRRRLDPGWPSSCEYPLPGVLGKTVVTELNFDANHGQQEYLRCLNQANIFIAPRLAEGIGLSFIEALTRGFAVFAYDAPTMNEYISHKENGYLFGNYDHARLSPIQAQVKEKLEYLGSRLGLKSFEENYPVKSWQNWSEIKSLDLQTLGDNARQEQFKRFKAWQDSIPMYASFILDW